MIENGSCHANLFSYVTIPKGAKRHFCLQQNILRLAWVIFLKEASFSPITRSGSCPSGLMRIGRWIRSFAGMVKSNLKVLGEFWQYQRQGGKINGVLELPCFGQVCLPVHQGYKVFDFYRKTVTKVFDQDVSHAVVKHEIEVLREISDLAFATPIRKWDVEERWYQEVYTPGLLDSSYTPMDSHALINQFSKEQVHLLTGLIGYRQPRYKQVMEYVLEVTGFLPSVDWSRLGMEARDIQHMTSFLDATITQLRPEGNRTIILTFSHGDFVPANMLNARDGVKLIDWEDAGYRSVLYDLYSYFFYRTVSRNMPVSIVLDEVQRALPLFLAELVETRMDVVRSVSDWALVYRRTFYVEMIARLINRALSDKNLPILHYLHRYLDTFMRYEEMSAEQSMPDSQSAN